MRKEWQGIEDRAGAEIVRDDLQAQGYRASIKQRTRKDGTTVYTVYSNGYRRELAW